jgi:hypothetical protein
VRYSPVCGCGGRHHHRGKPEVLEVIFEDLNTMVPARTDYRYKENFNRAAAHTKSALLGYPSTSLSRRRAGAWGKHGILPTGIHVYPETRILCQDQSLQYHFMEVEKMFDKSKGLNYIIGQLHLKPLPGTPLFK